LVSLNFTFLYFESQICWFWFWILNICLNEDFSFQILNLFEFFFLGFVQFFWVLFFNYLIMIYLMLENWVEKEIEKRIFFFFFDLCCMSFLNIPFSIFYFGFLIFMIFEWKRKIAIFGLIVIIWLCSLDGYAYYESLILNMMAWDWDLARWN
jgi:hypothetical protein